MTKLFQALQEEKEYLEKMKCEAEEDIKQDGKDKIPGKLRIQKKGNSVQYYHTYAKNEKMSRNQRSAHQQQSDLEKQAFSMEESQIRQETYIPKKSIALARNLAQRDYDNKLIHEIAKRQTLLNSFLNTYPKEGLETVYDNQNEYRRNLINPIIESDEQFAKIWINTPYVRKIVGDDVPEIFTENGERVRSKSEKMIADKLKQLGIPYRYEAPLRLNRACVLHPDFTVLNIRTRKEYYYEHFGMMDNLEYAESAMKRIELYEKNGIFPGDKLLFSWETQTAPLNMKIVEAMIRKFLL